MKFDLDHSTLWFEFHPRFHVALCIKCDMICFGKGNEEELEFFYVHKNIFIMMSFRLPFTYLNVMCWFNDVSSQLNFISLKYMRYFKLVCNC